MHYNPSGGADAASSKNAKKKAAPIDFTDLLNALRNQIKEIHRLNIGMGEIEAKPTLNLLNVSIFLIQIQI